MKGRQDETPDRIPRNISKRGLLQAAGAAGVMATPLRALAFTESELDKFDTDPKAFIKHKYLTAEVNGEFSALATNLYNRRTTRNEPSKADASISIKENLKRRQFKPTLTLDTDDILRELDKKLVPELLLLYAASIRRFRARHPDQEKIPAFLLNDPQGLLQAYLKTGSDIEALVTSNELNTNAVSFIRSALGGWEELRKMQIRFSVSETELKLEERKRQQEQK